ncbi:MAG: glycosyltransferase family 39 protein [Pyrinomonadaceae bacterium]|nr:glycosyltransferase family 39 protein [Phycisphaerales bacterium]
MKIAGLVTRKAIRHRWWMLPLMLLIALWLPAADQGGYRTDTHYYAAIALQAWKAALSYASVTPLLDLRAGDRVYMNKPPLAFILHGEIITWLGLSMWTVRLGSLLAAMLTCVATSILLRRLAGWRVAMMSGLVLATTVEFFRYTRAISLDLWQCAFVMISLAMLVMGIPRDDKNENRLRRGWMVAAGVPLGLALLCKPFMALLAPLLFIAWLALRRKHSAILMTIAAMIVGVAVALPWHVWMWHIHGDEFLRVYVQNQSIDRAVGNAGDMPGVQEPWWFYFNVIATTYAPWLLSAICGGSWLLRRRRPSGGSFALMQLAVVWSVAWLIVLTVFDGKSSRYTVIIWPLLSAMSGLWIVHQSQGAAGMMRTVGRYVMLWLGPAAVFTGVLLTTVPLNIHKPRDFAWDQLLKEVDAHPDRELVCTQRAHHIAANLVMLGRTWPPMMEESPGMLLTGMDASSPEFPSAAGPGTYVLDHAQEYDPQRLPGDLIMKSEMFVLVLQMKSANPK